MIQLLLNILAGPLVNAVMGVINKHYDVQMNRDVLKAEVEKAVLGTIRDVTSTQADVIKAEINAQDKITRIWRPLVAMSLCSVLMFYAVVTPVAVAWFGAPPVRVGDVLLGWIFTLCNVCLGGYIASRGVEKIVETIVAGWRR